MKKQVLLNGEHLLELHQLHLGLYARVAKKLKFDPAYISRVARGERESEEVTAALLKELRKIYDSAA